MKKWKYLKGDESDFAGDQNTLMIVKSASTGHVHHLGLAYSGRDKDIERVGDTVIAYREPIEDDEQDLNDCIGAPEARNCSPEESRLREGVAFDAPFKFLTDGQPLRGINCRCHTTPISEIDGTESVIYPGLDALIAERGSRYGKFKDGADIMQSLKDVMREVDGWNNLTPSQKEALDMIQHKVGRILNGDPNYDDSWKDIAGYATLIANELNGEIK